MNNPAIVGCWDQDAGLGVPTLMRQQLHTVKSTGDAGRIDLVGLNIKDDEYELRIFELKNGKIDIPAVDQLKQYLEGWHNQTSAKSEIKKWMLELGMQDIDEIINNPTGVLVGTEFDYDAISKAREYKLQGIRLARFRAKSGMPDYYVIIEDQIGDVIKWAKRPRIGWSPFISNGLIKSTDIFQITTKDRTKILARPDPESFGTDSKKLIFDEESTRKILAKLPEREEHIINIKKKAEEEGWSIKWFEKVIQQIKDGKGVLISHATGVVGLIFDPSIGWHVPGQYWVHKETGKLLNTIKDEYYEM